LCAAVESRKPVILVPGTYASQLKITCEDCRLKWYCPKNLKDQVFWLDEKYIIPPTYNCLFHWLSQTYNETDKCAGNIEGADIDVIDFGGLAGVTNVDAFLKYNISFIPYYRKLVQKFEENGYIEGKTLFGAPADWRRGIACQDLFFQRTKALIEKIYKESGEKVVMIGHSFGCYLTHYFLADAMTKEWVEKYVDHSLLIAPSFGGSGKSVEVGWTHSYEKYIQWTTAEFKKISETIGAIHVHFPNYELYGDTPIIYGPDGEGYSAREVPELFLKKGKITPENYKIMQLQIPYLSRVVPKPNCKTIVVYNNQIATTMALKVSDWNNTKTVKSTTAPGDSTVLAQGVEKFCELYPEVECRNLNDPKKTASHFGMLKNDQYVDLYYNLSQ
jgi:lecithin-cholesterol acyltransferase